MFIPIYLFIFLSFSHSLSPLYFSHFKLVNWVKMVTVEVTHFKNEHIKADFKHWNSFQCRMSSQQLTLLFSLLINTQSQFVSFWNSRYSCWWLVAVLLLLLCPQCSIYFASVKCDSDYFYEEKKTEVIYACKTLFLISFMKYRVIAKSQLSNSHSFIFNNSFFLFFIWTSLQSIASINHYHTLIRNYS